MDALEVSDRRLNQSSAVYKSLFPLIVIILLGMVLRLVPLVADPLHQDEALYGYWGRLVKSGRDIWLTTVAVDKPPLALYLNAASQAVFGVSEFSLRVPALTASLLSISLTYVLARRLFGAPITALVAATMMAVTAYPVLFGAASFTDAILVAWWLAACYAAVRGRWGWTGILLGLTFATKQQAVLLAPLVIAFGIIYFFERADRARWRVALAKFVVGLVTILALVLIWDVVRIAGGAAMSFWTQGVVSYGGMRLIWPTELVPRLGAWMRLCGYFLGWPWLTVLFLGSAAAVLWWGNAQKRTGLESIVDVILSAFALAYLSVHVLIAFPVWDRYLLPMAPVLAILVGRAVAAGYHWALGRYGQSRSIRFVCRSTFLVVVVLSMMVSGLRATTGRIPVGADHGAYDGFADVAAFLRELPVGTVLYDRWLSWHYDFYLFDAYLFRAGFLSPSWLAADAKAFLNGGPRFLVVPSWESPARLERVLGEVDLLIRPVFRTLRRNGDVSFVVYEIGTRVSETR